MPAPRQTPPAAAGVFSGITIAIAIEDEAWNGEGLGDIEALAHRCFAAAAAAAGLPGDVETEIGLTLSDDARVRALNAEWRGKDRPTNVLSFPLAELVPGERPGPMLGDLVLARETLRSEAKLENKSFGDHFCHLVVHGMLHCLGYDHVEPSEADAMEALEIRILDGLGIADPYLLNDTEEEPLRA